MNAPYKTIYRFTCSVCQTPYEFEDPTLPKGWWMNAEWFLVCPLHSVQIGKSADATPVIMEVAPTPKPRPAPKPKPEQPTTTATQVYDYLAKEPNATDQLDRLAAVSKRLADSSKRTFEDIKDAVTKPFMRALIGVERLSPPPHASYNIALPVLEAFAEKSPLDLLTKPTECGKTAKAGVDFMLRAFATRESKTKQAVLAKAIQKFPGYLPNLLDTVGDITELTDAEIIKRVQ